MPWWNPISWFKVLSAAPEMGKDITETGKILTEGIVSGIDALVLTDEELIKYKLKGADITLAFWDKIREENSLQSMARRELALLTMKSFFAMLFLAILTKVLGIHWKALDAVAKFILEIALSGIVGGLVISIGCIYFGPHQLSKIVNFKKE